MFPGLHVAVYPVIAEPPLEAGMVNATVAWPLPGVAVPIVGAPGAVMAVSVTSLPSPPV